MTVEDFDHLIIGIARTRAQQAEALGVSLPTLYRYLRGTTPIPQPVIILAKMLGGD